MHATKSKWLVISQAVLAVTLLATTALAADCLIISEVVQGVQSGDYPRWIEITNTGDEDFTFDGGGIIIQMDGDTDLTIDVDMTDVVIPAGSSFVINSTAEGAGGAYYGTYGAQPDMSVNVLFGNGDDRYILTDAYDSSHLIDIYGEIDVDGTGEVWEYTRGYSFRLPSYNAGNGGVFDPAEWHFGGVDSLDGPDPQQMMLTYTDPQRHTWHGTCIPCLGDLNGDDVVNLSDLAQLLGNYGTTSGAAYEDGDLNGDGAVNLSDLAALLAVYGTQC